MIGSGREGVGKTAKGYACSDGGELLCLLTLYEKGTGGCRRGGGRRVRRLKERGDGDRRGGTDKRMLVEGEREVNTN